MLADIFNNFWNMCLEIYGFDLVHCHSALELVGQAAFKKSKAKSKVFNGIDIVIMVERGIRGGICQFYSLIFYSKILFKSY